MNLTALDADTDAVIFPLDEGRTRGRCRDEHCRAEMVAVRETAETVDGERFVTRRAHWRHKVAPDGVTTCTRRDGRKTMWHVNWQLECDDPARVEHRVMRGERARIADVFTKFGWALEFQHSVMETKTLRARENHYRGSVLWIVNAASDDAIHGSVDEWKGQLRWTDVRGWVIDSRVLVAVDSGPHVYLLPPGGLRQYVKGSQLLIPMSNVRALTRDDFVGQWVNGEVLPLPVEPNTEWRQMQAERDAKSRNQSLADRRLQAASRRKGAIDPLGDVCTYAGDRERLAYADDQPARTVVIGKSIYAVPMCRHAGCPSAAGTSGWCWSHRPADEIAEVA